CGVAGAAALATLAPPPRGFRPAGRCRVRGGGRRNGRCRHGLWTRLALPPAPPWESCLLFVDQALLQEPAREVPARKRVAVRRPRRSRAYPRSAGAAGPGLDRGRGRLFRDRRGGGLELDPELGSRVRGV